MKLDYIKEFLILAETLNYSRTAEVLYSSQSTLSRHITIVEEAVGAQLFARTTHSVELTEIGKKAVAVFGEMMNSYQWLTELARNRQNQISGRLVVGLLYYSTGELFSEFIPKFQEEYPAVSLDFKFLQPHTMYQELLDGKIDLGNMPVANYPQSENIRFHKFQRQNMIAVMRDDHPLADREFISLDMLRGESIVELDEDFCSRICTRELLKHTGFIPAESVLSANIESVPYTVKQSNGIHITGEFCKKQESRGLSYVPIREPGFQVELAFFYSMRNISPLVPIFLKELDQFLEKAKKS